jgi:hypothetical protein
VRAALAGAVLALVACGAAPVTDPRFPPRPVGCPVKWFNGSPSMATENIGAVSARCSEFVSDEDCLRTLQDEVCKLGGDVVWGVSKLQMEDGKKRVNGRAAHTTDSPTPGQR